MFRKMIETVKEFIKEGNTPEMKKIRQEVSIEAKIESSRWTMYVC